MKTLLMRDYYYVDEKRDKHVKSISIIDKAFSVAFGVAARRDGSLCERPSELLARSIFDEQSPV